jgi:hypothetical protein
MEYCILGFMEQAVLSTMRSTAWSSQCVATSVLALHAVAPEHARRARVFDRRRGAASRFGWRRTHARKVHLRRVTRPRECSPSPPAPAPALQQPHMHRRCRPSLAPAKPSRCAARSAFGRQLAAPLEGQLAAPGQQPCRVPAVAGSCRPNPRRPPASSGCSALAHPRSHSPSFCLLNSSTVSPARCTRERLQPTYILGVCTRSYNRTGRPSADRRLTPGAADPHGCLLRYLRKGQGSAWRLVAMVGCLFVWERLLLLVCACVLSQAVAGV